MLVSLKQVNKFLQLQTNPISKDELENIFNRLGYEVESVTPFSQAQGIKFGKVLDVKPNPNSKNLNVVQLETATGNVTIQTVATNAQVGYWAVAFVEGAKLGEITFTTKMMAGVASQGMLSGFPELGYDVKYLPYSEDDLVMLNTSEFPELNLTTDPLEFFDLNDFIFDITTPANRSDVNSYATLVDEIAAEYGVTVPELLWTNKPITKSFKVNQADIKIAKVSEFNQHLMFFEVDVKNAQTKFANLLLLAKHHIEVKNIWAIDMTNLALLLLGTPVHAYDATKIGKKLWCELYTGKLEILGKKEVDVKDVIIVRDENKPISIASVMGLENSAVTAQTQKVVFEIGTFDSKKIRQAAKQIKIDSSASVQGARGISGHTLLRVFDFIKNQGALDGLATAKIAPTLAGKNFNEYLTWKNDAELKKHSFLPKSRKIRFNPKTLALYANVSENKAKLQFKDAADKLEKLGFLFLNRTTGKKRIKAERLSANTDIYAPLYRNDVKSTEDIIEELFRFTNYDSFVSQAPKLRNYEVQTRNVDKEKLAGAGYQEVRTFSLTSKEKNKFNPFAFEQDVNLKTFVSLEREVVRNSILPSLLEVAEYNLKRKITSFNLFENGMINYNEYVYGLVSSVKSVQELKQDVTNFLGTNNLSFAPFTDNELVHPKVSAKIYQDGKFIGWVGKFIPTFDKYGLVVAEFKTPKQTKKTTLFAEYNNEPFKSIDLTFELEPQTHIKHIVDELQTKFKVYEIKQIDEFLKDDKNYPTLRITAEAETIQLINDYYNKK
ncbi:phenylalanine--tRNA ligase subunit beta [Mycoplasmopsis columbinasalis]|uniref:Phenylalanine--tRNA ligase beta subunit n=1 Tax=Mycoplasmopsis columbinasalis TaxID=114880 RepID=A0A449BAH9_9BACT|nr:phenylalanine--tRNA ligase subunit beta [Mycoplasmopsis columbinasalis]VEU78211.1 Phenylalanine--tRNA ligase beta subunit [Mycoplasmopsis columbinasalis]